MTETSLALTSEAAERSGEPRRRLLVYQMAKVASLSWVALGRNELALDDIFHIHFLSDESVAFMRELIAAPDAVQTIARRMMVRNGLRHALEGREQLPSICSGNDPWLIVTGLRDPVARSISLLFFMGDFFGCTDRPLSWRDGASQSSLERAFREMWDRVLGDAPPADTFGRLLHFYVGIYEQWFEREFTAVVGIDATVAEFPPGPAPRVIRSGSNRVLVYRVEDMPDGAAGNPILLNSIKSFCDSNIAALPVANATGERRTKPLYRQFVENLRLPTSLIDRIYSGKTVQRFYTANEIERFKLRWS